MIYSLGTTKEANNVKGKVLSAVYERALGIVSILDKYYGKDRDVYKNDGGFVFIAENVEDLSYFISHHIDPTMAHMKTLKYSGQNRNIISITSSA